MALTSARGDLQVAVTTFQAPRTFRGYRFAYRKLHAPKATTSVSNVRVVAQRSEWSEDPKADPRRRGRGCPSPANWTI